jgi:hypothetical protein
LTASPDAPSDLERLIEALEPHPEPDAVLLVPQEGEGEKTVIVEIKRWVADPEHADQHSIELRHETLEAYAAALEHQRVARERENAVRALARAAVERLMHESVTELMGLLEKVVEDLEASRHRAAQVEGEREPDDPYVILQVLPQEYHEWFLADYRRALREAYPAEGFLALQRMLRQWRKRAEWYSDPAYQEQMHEANPSPKSRPWAELRKEMRAQGRLR